MKENLNKQERIVEFYKKYFPEETLREFYGEFALEVLRGRRILPLSKKFFFFVEKVGLPKGVVDEIVLATLSYFFDDEVSLEELERAKTSPHVKEIKEIERILSEKELGEVKNRKRTPLYLYEKLKDKIGKEPFIKDYAKDYYRWLDGEFSFYPEVEGGKC